jgi:hypothetical protein
MHHGRSMSGLQIGLDIPSVHALFCRHGQTSRSTSRVAPDGNRPRTGAPRRAPSVTGGANDAIRPAAAGPAGLTGLGESKP